MDLSTGNLQAGGPGHSLRKQLAAIFLTFKVNWQQLLSIHIAINTLIVILLAPLGAGLLQLAISLSGNSALSDQDILLFLLSPLGLVAMLLVASIFLIMVVLEHAALFAAVFHAGRNGLPNFAALLDHLKSKIGRMFRLAVNILSRVLLTVLPFLLFLMVIYRSLLDQHDINFYLLEKPAEFLWAMALGGLIVASLIITLARQFIGWFFCLPLLLIEDLAPAQCIRRSVVATRGRRVQLGSWLAGWLIFSLFTTAIVAGLTGIAGHLLAPHAMESFNKILLALSFLLMLAAVLNFALTWVNSSVLSIIMVNLYRGSGLSPPVSGPVSNGKPRRLENFLKPAWLAAALIAGTLIAALVVNRFMENIEPGDRTQIMAHRGASSVAPENTLAAIRAAIDAGAQWVEIDVQETADGEVVVIHDRDLKRIAGQSIRVADSSLAELQQFDIGSWFDPGFSEQRVPTLRQALELAKNRIGVNIELKYYGGENRLEESVAEIVEYAGMAQQVVFMSLDYGGIQRMRKLRPDWNVGLLSSVSLGDLNQLNLDFLAVNAHSASRSLIRKIHQSGKKVMTWTVNDTMGMSSMLNRGADVIITDKPSLAIAVLKQRATLEPVQRLLMQLADVFGQPALYAEQ